MADDPLATIPVIPPDEITVRARPVGNATIELGERLAEGGMGEVLIGRQPRLARTVAIKRPHKSKRGARAALVTEALVTGALQHPNIVPVYDLYDDASGPLMVMKRLEGTVWSQLFEDPPALQPLLEGRSPLGFHIDVLLAVCNAVQFAHARGIVHRDLKPDNVMIGAFGEVTVLDWGLAVSLRPEDDGRFPLAKDVRRVAGTPAFMAPEMARADGSIDERTDVYLLGATLHFILTGRTRHEGADLDTVLQSVLDCEPPEWPDDVIPDLAAIATRAMHRDPERRHPTVEAFRQALLAFRQHVSSVKLADIADRRARILRDLVQLELAGQPQEAATVARVSTEGRFGYRQALEEWPGNPKARDGLEDLIRWTARFELHRGNPDPAEALLDELRDPDPELQAQLQQVRDERARREQAARELEQMAFDRDLSALAGRRSALGCATGLIVGVLCLTIGALDRSGIWPIGYPEMLVGVALFAAGIALSTAVIGRLRLNAVGRDQIRVMRMITVMLVVHWMVSWAAGLTVNQALAWNALLAGGMLIVGGTISDGAAVAAGLVYLPTAVGILAAPFVGFEIFGLGNILSYGIFSMLTGARLARL